MKELSKVVTVAQSLENGNPQSKTRRAGGNPWLMVAAAVLSIMFAPHLANGRDIDIGLMGGGGARVIAHNVPEGVIIFPLGRDRLGACADYNSGESSVISVALPSELSCTFKDNVFDENNRYVRDDAGNFVYEIHEYVLPLREIYVGTVYVGMWGFQNCTLLQSITIPNSVTNISGNSFAGCSSLQGITIPDSVIGLGGSAFYGCSSLRSAVIGNGVNAIEQNTFYQCGSLETITLGNSVRSIGDSAFYQCGSLVEVAIPASVTNIALTAFKSCDGLQRFIVDPANPVYASYDGALYTKDLKTLVCYPGGRTDVNLPSGEIETKEDAFTGCGKLWAEWYRSYRKTRYDLSDDMEDRAIASVTVSGDTSLGPFVLKDGKVYDAVLYIDNVADHAVNLTLPQGNAYKTFKGARPLTIPAVSQSILTITRIAGDSANGNVFLVTREDLEGLE